MGIEYEQDHTLVRGLDYYNGVCFEVKLYDSNDENLIRSCLGESQNTVLAGGRYDYLASHFGYNRSEGLNCAGWAAGIDRLALVLDYLDSKKPKLSLVRDKSLIGVTFVIVNTYNLIDFLVG